MSRAWPPAALGLALTLTALIAAPLPARTEPTVIYRCTAPDGEVTFQNGTPCVAGHQQQRRVIDIAAPLPAFVPAPAAPARAPAVPLISSLPAARSTATAGYGGIRKSRSR